MSPKWLGELSVREEADGCISCSAETSLVEQTMKESSGKNDCPISPGKAIVTELVVAMVFIAFLYAAVNCYR